MAYTKIQRRQHIAELQKYLYTISLFNENVPPLLPDGVYGERTANAVRAFQREYGLEETGSTDPAVWSKVVSVYREYMESEPLGYRGFPSKKHSVKNGDSGTLVYILQAMLDGLADKYDNMPHVAVCGKYNTETANAVNRFRKLVGLPVCGTVDVKTWNLLVRFCEHTDKIK